jgi:hypothetical protein
MKRDGITDILGRHGTMKFAGMVPPKRRSLPGDPRIRKFLNTRRKTASPEQESIIWRALFALYGIPEEWPREFRLEWLAGRLAAELFPRCQTLAKRRGRVPGKNTSLKKRKERLLNKLAVFWRSRPRLKSRIRAAEIFLIENSRACQNAGFTKAKSLSQALKKKASE